MSNSHTKAKVTEALHNLVDKLQHLKGIHTLSLRLQQKQQASPWMLPLTYQPLNTTTPIFSAVTTL